MTQEKQIKNIERDWAENPRWTGIKRGYAGADVVRLRGSVQIEYTIARMGAERLWNLMKTENYVNALGAMTGGQAVQQVQAGLPAFIVRAGK
jgi:isocitrate lyase